MITFDLEQFRALVNSGGVLSVTLEGVGKDFAVRIETRRGDGTLVLSNAKHKPRTFADPRRALLLLRDLGIREARLDTKNWTPQQTSLGSEKC